MPKLQIIYILFMGMVLQMCAVPESKNIKDNPYPDDYSKIASLSHRDLWNGANVHDPSSIKIGDTYYLYSTDAYYIPPNINFRDDSTVHMGHIQIRSSKDLVHWSFEGWAFDQLPKEAFNHVKEANDGKAPKGIWAPFIRKVEDEYRLYYSVSYFGTNGSFIGLAISNSPLGPWEDKGAVVKTTYQSKINAIDPSVVTDKKTGRDWMIYGSYFGGLYCMELNPLTGLALIAGDQGNCVARRADGQKRIIEAPEIVYNNEQDMYYLFVSYDPLFTFYNIRVGRSKSPNGPFLDYFGNDLKDTTNNYPILTHSYQFKNHPGWSGNGHCGILKDNGKYFVMHQGRLAPDNHMMQLQCREIKWLRDGWPVFSPERYHPVKESGGFCNKDMVGTWEMIELQDITDQGKLLQGQIMAGGWKYSQKVYNLSTPLKMLEKQTFNKGNVFQLSSFSVNQNSIKFSHIQEQVFECELFWGWDWENKCETLLLSGILPNGHGVWGKKIITN